LSLGDVVGRHVGPGLENGEHDVDAVGVGAGEQIGPLELPGREQDGDGGGAMPWPRLIGRVCGWGCFPR
jgi:hypothetical protein